MEVEALKWKDEGREEREREPKPLTGTGGRRGRTTGDRDEINHPLGRKRVPA